IYRARGDGCRLRATPSRHRVGARCGNLPSGYPARRSAPGRTGGGRLGRPNPPPRGAGADAAPPATPRRPKSPSDPTPRYGPQEAGPMSAPNKSYDPKAAASLAPGEVTRVLDEALAAVAAAGTLDELKTARIAHEGDRAPLSLASAEIGALPPEARAEAGRRVGAAHSQLRPAARGRPAGLEARPGPAGAFQRTGRPTPPGGRTPLGARHPVTSLGDRLSDVFVAMGYEVAEGPEAEAEWYNFDALNMLPDHPARDAQDTIFIQSPAGPARKSGVVLRTQTSP